MNKKKTTAKGFTLIELIIVLAIFSVIMTLVMSFIDPVSKVMSKTSIKERTAAYVDNIGEYVSKSIRYAQNINVYEKGLNGADEATVVRDFIDTYYDGAVDENLASLTGKVHVLKLINDDGGPLQAGGIYESVYSFTAGQGRPGIAYIDGSYNEVDVTGMSGDEIKDAGYTQVKKMTYGTYNGMNFPNATVTLEKADISVINDEHFKDYSYYYQLGMYTFDPITNPADYGLAEDINAKFFYSRLNKMLDASNAVLSDAVNEYQFVVNVVSFNNEQDDTGAFVNKIDASYTVGEGDDVTTENITVFRSPAAMSSVGMTLKNVQLQKRTSSEAVKYYRISLNEEGKPLDADGNEITDGSTPAIEAVTSNLRADPFRRITEGTSNDIYIIFTVPTEINDTEWKFS